MTESAWIHVIHGSYTVHFVDISCTGIQTFGEMDEIACVII